MTAGIVESQDIKENTWVEMQVDGIWSWNKITKVFLDFSTSKNILTLEDNSEVELFLNQDYVVSDSDPSEISLRVEVPNWDEYFLEISRTVGLRAKCRRRQVGSVIVDGENRIVSTGYNGFPAGVTPDCLQGGCPRGLMSQSDIKAYSSYEDSKSAGYCPSIHAEANALLNSVRSVRGFTAYITDAPCNGCQKLLAGAGIVRAVWPQGEMVPNDLYKQHKSSI